MNVLWLRFVSEESANHVMTYLGFWKETYFFGLVEETDEAEHYIRLVRLFSRHSARSRSFFRIVRMADTSWTIVLDTKS